MHLIQRLGLHGLLSFPPDMEPIELQPLNALIGPNGAGKTNLVEALGLLRALPTDFAAAIRAGGGAAEWLWKGPDQAHAEIGVEIDKGASSTKQPLRYGIRFTSTNNRVEVLDENVRDTNSESTREQPRTYYSFNKGHPVIGTQETPLSSANFFLAPDESVLERARGTNDFPELMSLSQAFSRIAMLREWSFGTDASMRMPCRTDYPPDELLPHAKNLTLVLNEILHRDSRPFEVAMKRFLPRFNRISTRIIGNTVQLFLHERGLMEPIPATRLSDGTLRFLAILVVLFAPTPATLLCLEEPELGMHPDAVGLLGRLLVEASDRMQVIVTTHSDALLSAFDNQVDSVLVCENNGHGTKIKHLDAKALTFWLDKYSLGDIWRMGKIGGNP